jgi:chemotaxis protein methyltransferase CheR
MLDSLDISDDALAEISMILEMRRNFSMSVYKDKCMKRRIAIRMRSCRCHDAASYCNMLRQDERELDLLQKAITIHVSQFFRNPSMFELLRTSIIPELFDRASSATTPLRLLSLGCAGGEEAYSLGIVLRENFSRELLHTAVSINGYDIDTDTLTAARLGEYTEERLKDVPDELRGRYFVQNGSRLQLAEEIRAMVSFCRHDLMNVAALEPCQIAMCRNTLIYFTRPDQERILRGIADILVPGGILVLGKSETLVGEVRTLFSSVCPVERVYRRLDIATNNSMEG